MKIINNILTLSTIPMLATTPVVISSISNEYNWDDSTIQDIVMNFNFSLSGSLQNNENTHTYQSYGAAFNDEWDYSSTGFSNSFSTSESHTIKLTLPISLINELCDSHSSVNIKKYIVQDESSVPATVKDSFMQACIKNLSTKYNVSYSRQFYNKSNDEIIKYLNNNFNYMTNNNQLAYSLCNTLISSLSSYNTYSYSCCWNTYASSKKVGSMTDSQIVSNSTRAKCENLLLITIDLNSFDLTCQRMNNYINCTLTPSPSTLNAYWFSFNKSSTDSLNLTSSQPNFYVDPATDRNFNYVVHSTLSGSESKGWLPTGHWDGWIGGASTILSNYGGSNWSPSLSGYLSPILSVTGTFDIPNPLEE